MSMTLPEQSRGVGLIEVLVALVIIAVGLLGLLSLESHANHAEMESYQRAQALVLVRDMVHRMMTNPGFAACYVLANTQYAYLGTDANGNTITYSDTHCDTAADHDLGEWNTELQGANNAGGLIDARGCITMVPAVTNEYKIEVAWQGLSAIAAPPAADTCGSGLYTDASGKADPNLRRDISYTFRL